MAWKSSEHTAGYTVYLLAYFKKDTFLGNHALFEGQQCEMTFS